MKKLPHTLICVMIILLVVTFSVIVQQLPSSSTQLSSDDEYYVSASDIEMPYQPAVAKARVLRVADKDDSSYGENETYLPEDTQRLIVKVTNGELKGRCILVTYDLSDPLSGNGDFTLEPAKRGDNVLIQPVIAENGTVSGYVTEFGRSRGLLWLGVIFLALLIFFGGRRGLRSIVALLTICIGLVFIIVPLMLRGVNPVWAAILGCIFAVSTTLIMVYGFTVKTLASALGAVGGLVFAGILTSITNMVMHMTGLMDEDWVYLALSLGYDSLDLRGILFASIIISVLGGTIDVGVSIASALEELRDKAPDITGSELFTSGINIGIDIMGASLNTLILSFVGSSVPMVMLCCTYNIQLTEIINKELISNEILRALTGSFGLLLTVPLTSFIAAVMMCRGHWGHFDPSCFESVALIKNALASLRHHEKKQVTIEKSKTVVGKSDIQYETDDLYAAAKRHREELENRGDTFSD